MVSFQCDGCADVVKKPKLDQHSNRCGASFTCVDCSKTFNNQREWKGHTSCISEAEKYQKSLYKGKKQGAEAGPRGDKKSASRPVLQSANGAVNEFDMAEKQTEDVVNGTASQTGVGADATGNTVPCEKAEKKDKKRKRDVVAEKATEAKDKKETKKDKKKKRKELEASIAAEDGMLTEKRQLAESGAASEMNTLTMVVENPATDSNDNEEGHKKKRKRKDKSVANADSPSDPIDSGETAVTQDQDEKVAKKEKKRKLKEAAKEGAQDVALPESVETKRDTAEKEEKRKRKEKKKAKKLRELEVNGDLGV